MSDRQIDPGSFRDPSGFVFRSGRRLLRQVNLVYREHYDQLISSGLYADLAGEGLLVAHAERDAEDSPSGDCYKVLEPERIEFVSYPYEWCFSQLKDAALLTLKIQQHALARGMVLKDSSAYNIQFRRARPVHIDTLSFERYREGSPWIAYRQFCQHFLAPLALMSRTDARCSQLLRVHVDGIPLDLASRLLPLATRLSLPLLLHVHLHARAERRFSSAAGSHAVGRVSLMQLRALIDHLVSAVRSLSPPAGRPGWSGYYSMDSYSGPALQSKESIVAGYLGRTSPRTVWDLGANTGRFSRLAAAAGAATLSVDSDHDAVEANYREACRRGETLLMPLWVDLMNPSAGLGWHNRERLPLVDRGLPEMVFALALVHHLAIAQNVPLEMIASFLASLTRRWLVVEFVPKSDPKTRLLLASRLDIFDHYTPGGFEAAFRRWFGIEQVNRVADSRRVLYLMRKLA